MNYLRSGVRIPVGLPAHVEWKGRGSKTQRAQGKAAVMSGNGLFLELPIRLRLDTPITVTVTLPLEVTGSPLELCCEGRVVRQGQKGDLRGFGAVIDDYRIRPGHQVN
jgi:PilZ domain-containing protein